MLSGPSMPLVYSHCIIYLLASCGMSHSASFPEAAPSSPSLNTIALDHVMQYGDDVISIII